MSKKFLQKSVEFIFLRKKLFLCLFVGAALFLFVADESFWSRMATIDDYAAGTSGEVNRMYFWMKTFDIVKSYPFGTGFGGYQHLSPALLPPEYLTNGIRAVHSTYFQVFTEYGFPGIIMFLFLIYSNLSSLRKTQKFLLKKGNNTEYLQAVFLESSFVAYLTAIMFIDRYYSVVLYLMMLFIACFVNIHNSSNKQLDIG